MINKTKRCVLILALLVIFALLTSTLALAISASLKTSSDTITSLYYTGTSGSTSYFYKDAQSPNSDIGIELCGVGQKYVALVFVANISGTMAGYDIAVSYGNDAPNALEDTVASAGDCYKTTPVGNFQVSPSHLSSRDPEVYVAAFPGLPYVLYADSADGQTNASYYAIPEANGSLLGSYAISSLDSYFNETTKNVTIIAPTITFTTQSGSFTKLANDSSFGVNSDRSLIIAVCNSTRGQACNSGAFANYSSVFPMSLYAGVASPSESTTYTRYLDINGYDLTMCIGPELEITSVTVNTTAVSAGQQVRVTANYENSGNVAVTTDFDVEFYFDEGLVNTTTVSGGLTVGETGSVYYDVDTTGYSSGTLTTAGNLSIGAIADCDGGNNQDAGPSVTISKIITPYVLIDGTETDVFNRAGRPYNISIYLNDTDGATRSGLIVKVTEVNGLTIFTPMQTAETEGTATSSFTGGQSTTNSSGYVEFTLIPTGNKLFTAPYEYLNVSDAVGNYSLYFEVFNGSTEQIISKNGQIVTEWEFNLTNMTINDPSTSEQNTLTVLNQDTYVSDILEYVNQAFASAFGWLLQ